MMKCHPVARFSISVSGTVLIKLAPHFIMELMDKIRHGDKLSLIHARGFFSKRLQRRLLLLVRFKHKSFFLSLLACSEEFVSVLAMKTLLSIIEF